MKKLVTYTENLTKKLGILRYASVYGWSVYIYIGKNVIYMVVKV